MSKQSVEAVTIRPFRFTANHVSDMSVREDDALAIYGQSIYGAEVMQSEVSVRQQLLRMAQRADMCRAAMLGHRSAPVAGIVTWSSDRAKKGTYRLNGIAVHPEYTRQGIGSKLLGEVALDAFLHNNTSVWLTALPDAVQFYEKHGFQALDEGYDWVDMAVDTNVLLNQIDSSA